MLNQISLALSRVIGRLGAAAQFNFSQADQAFDSRITYTGDSARTYFDSTGTLRYAPMNLLTYSQDFSNAAWVKNETTVSGTDTIIPSAVSSAVHRVQQGSLSFQSGVSITLAGKVKASGYNFILVRVSNSGESIAFQVNLNVSAGSLVSAASAYGSGASVAGATITAAAEGDGWFDFTLTGAISGVTSCVATVYVYNAAGAPTFAGDGTSGVKVKNFQINPGTTALDYIPTTSAAVYLPRANAYQDHDPSTLESLGFLIEEQRTNSHLHSQDATNAAWGTPANLTLSLAAGTAPDGTNTLNQALETSATGLHAQDGTAITFVTSTTYTYSMFVQSVGGRDFELGFPGTIFTARFGKFNLATGTVRSADAGVTATIKAVGNGTYRVSISAACASGAGGRAAYFVNDATGSRSYAGDITKGVKVWGAQYEVGAFPTSYIPTTTAAATRLADSATITGSNFSGFWNQTEGTVVLSANTLSATTYRPFLQADGGTANDRYLFDSESSSGRFLVFTGGVLQAVLPVATISANIIYKFAGAYKINDIAACADGGSISSVTSATLPTVNALRLGLDTVNYLNGHIQSLTYYNKRLPDATLQSLTV